MRQDVNYGKLDQLFMRLKGGQVRSPGDVVMLWDWGCVLKIDS